MSDKLLRVEAPHFVAGAVFEKYPEWHCVRAAPIIKWMVGKDIHAIKDYLIKKKWTYSWH